MVRWRVYKRRFCAVRFANCILQSRVAAVERLRAAAAASAAAVGAVGAVGVYAAATAALSIALFGEQRFGSARASFLLLQNQQPLPSKNPTVAAVASNSISPSTKLPWTVYAIRAERDALIELAERARQAYEAATQRLRRLEIVDDHNDDAAAGAHEPLLLPPPPQPPTMLRGPSSIAAPPPPCSRNARTDGQTVSRECAHLLISL